MGDLDSSIDSGSLDMASNRNDFAYYRSYPRILFYRPENGSGRPVRGMHFVLSLNDTDKKEEYDEMVKNVEYCGGIVTYDLKDLKEHSILIVDHEELVSESVPAFRVQYINDCFEMGKCINLEHYRQERSKEIRSDLNGDPNSLTGPHGLMDVVYFHCKSWNLPSTSRENANNNSDETMDCVPPKIITLNVELHEQPGRSKSPTESERVNNTPSPISKRARTKSPTGNERVSTPPDSPTGSAQGNAHHDSPTRSDEEVSKQPKTKKVPPEQAFTAFAIPKSPTITEQCLNCGFKYTSNRSLNARSEQESSSSSSSSPRTEEPERVGSRVSSNGGSWNHADSDMKKQFAANAPKKRTNRAYTDSDREAIVQYIVARKEYERVKGRELWQIMERKQILPQRTWQSMKEHYLKKIVLDLDKIPFLSNEQKKLIKKYGV